MQKKQKSILGILIALVIIFVWIVCAMTIPPLQEALQGQIFVWLVILGGGGSYTILGIVLIVLTIKQKIKGKLKAFLLLTGISSTGFLIGTVGHNMLYALGTVVEHIKILYYLTEGLSAIFFFIAIPLAPIGFLVGVVGSIILFIKK